MTRTIRLSEQEIGEAIREWVDRREGRAPDRVTLAYDPGDPPFSGFFYANAEMPEPKARPATAARRPPR